MTYKLVSTKYKKFLGSIVIKIDNKKIPKHSTLFVEMINSTV